MNYLLIIYEINKIDKYLINEEISNKRMYIFKK